MKQSKSKHNTKTKTFIVKNENETKKRREKQINTIWSRVLYTNAPKSKTNQKQAKYYTNYIQKEKNE